MTLDIDSDFHIGGYLPIFTQEQIKNEPMLFNCSNEVARELGGPITQSFLDAFIGLDLPLIIDTRVHMLMPGWYPCIPGWHHDDVPRTRSDGQPNYIDPEYNAGHAMALINGDICPTEFAIGKCTLPEIPIGEVIYKKWHPIVENYCNTGVLTRVSVPSNRIVWFNSQAFHQGVSANGNGWRWFGRISFNTNRKPTNEIRRQVQVYLEFPMEGW